jgi:sugar lactone lactonase YvrE
MNFRILYADLSDFPGFRSAAVRRAVPRNSRTSLTLKHIGAVRFVALLLAGFSSRVALQAQSNYAVPYTFTTLAGEPLSAGSSDGSGAAARFYHPCGVATDGAGDLYVADTDNHIIRKIVASTGAVTTLAGLAGSSGSTDGTGSAARFNSPSGVAIDSAGNIYVSDTLNYTLRKITAQGVVSTLAGAPGIAGSVDGSGSAARFYGPQGLAINPDPYVGTNDIYITDTNNHTIRKVVPSTGVVTTVAGLAGSAGSADGVGSLGRFNCPSGVAVDLRGTVWVADTENHTIRAVWSTGQVFTAAGLAGASGVTDGAGNVARFNSPTAVALGPDGNLYVADTDNHTIRMYNNGAVSTLAGLAGTSGSADGLGSAARFFSPAGVVADSSGNLYVADTDNQTLRTGLPAAPVIEVQPQSQDVTVGTDVQFSVTASGHSAITYQWFFNGTAISGATSSTYRLADAQPSNQGDYTVAVSNGLYSVTSKPATLIVLPTIAIAWSDINISGGGAPSAWFLGLLSLLALARRVAAAKTSDGEQPPPSVSQDIVHGNPLLACIRRTIL